MTRSVLIFTICGLFASKAGLAQNPGKHGLTINDMLAMQRISEPEVSPDGQWVAFSVRDTDFAANRGRMDVWLAKLDGTSVRRLTTHPDNDLSPSWSADGKSVYFLSSRSGTVQVWRIAAHGGEAVQVTKVPLDVNGFKLFPNDKRIVLAMDVWPNAKSLAENVKLDEAKAASKVKAHIYDQLLFRHWDTWEDGKYSHLFVWTPPEAGGKADDAKDLTPGQTTDSPTHPFGGMEEVSISPDGKSVAYVARMAGRANAWSTNTDILVVPSGGGKPVNMTAKFGGYDLEPHFSPDGKSIGFLSMERAGYEADRQRLAIVNVATKQVRIVTQGWDRSASSLEWSKDGKTIYTSSDNVGNHSLFSVDVASGKPTVLVDKGTNNSPRVAGDQIVFLRDTLTMPVEIFAMPAKGGTFRQVTALNQARTNQIIWGQYEQFSFPGAKGDTVYGYAMKPAGYKAGKVPVAFLIHGGPQGSFGDHFHYRWNPQVFAGAGYAVVFIDFHGSTGYGQKFTDAINGDWGGAPYEDLMKGLDFALGKYPWMDKDRLAALGASYGGYMINWIAGHTKRFKAMVCHDGNLDERMAYFDTEELWFPEWEHGGVPWEVPANYTKHNPIDYIKNWVTPTLVIHGGLDYRVVDTQGMSTFTALQRKGVPSRFLYFPDENHWVLKPQNAKLWHDQVIGWIDTYAKNGKK